jgi:ubiquinone/menaquinone biosynthesis C-methylase UbiE
VQDFGRLNPQQWHQRYLAQAGWTQHIRHYLFEKIKPDSRSKILEVGVGTGAVIEAVQKQGFSNFTGVDLDYPSLAFAQSNADIFKPAQADGHNLPFAGFLFDVCFCHYLLMWTADPWQILQEMRRVTQPGGWVIALAEPDHQGRIDYPPPLDALGKRQTQALADQGVDVHMGRKLRSLFTKSGLQSVEVGILGAQWFLSESEQNESTEWTMIRADLDGHLTQSELDNYEQQDWQAQQQSTRVLFIPTFYALGIVP